MADVRKKNHNWIIGTIVDGNTPSADAHLATLMDIRDELQALNSKLSCYRIPRALDGMIEIGVDLRRKERAAKAKRKAARQRKRA